MDDDKIIDVKAYVETVEPTKADKVKNFVSEKWTATKKFACDHGKEIIVGLPVVIGGARSLYKALKPTVYEQERKRIDHTYYDPSTGLHWELKRKLTNNERAELDRRRRNGEAVIDILKSMKVAKR